MTALSSLRCERKEPDKRARRVEKYALDIARRRELTTACTPKVCFFFGRDGEITQKCDSVEGDTSNYLLARM